MKIVDFNDFPSGKNTARANDHVFYCFTVRGALVERKDVLWKLSMIGVVMYCWNSVFYQFFQAFSSPICPFFCNKPWHVCPVIIFRKYCFFEFFSTCSMMSNHHHFSPKQLIDESSISCTGGAQVIIYYNWKKHDIVKSSARFVVYLGVVLTDMPQVFISTWNQSNNN